MTRYFRPIPVLDPANLPGTWPLAGGPLRFSHAEVLERGKPPGIISGADLPEDVIASLTAARPPIAGLGFGRPRLMGVLNVTPDSFSDGGAFAGFEPAMAQARRMLAEGADLIDIGGESTRPGAPETEAEVEIARVGPVFDALRAEGVTVPLSLDTRKSEVARAVRADVINDISGLRFDPALARVAAETETPLILMHSIGSPKTMQGLAADAYGDVLLDVYDALERAIARAVAAGVPRVRIMVDPGIGFGKTDPQNMALLTRLSLFHGLGCAILLGVSRKGMVGRIADVPDALARGPGSAGIGLWALSQGVQMLRVHDIALHRQMIATWRACAVGM